MLGLLTRSARTRKTIAPRSTSLFLERLEDRLSPAIIGVSSENLSLTVTYDPNKQVTLAGQLTGPTGPIANQALTLSGVVNGTATTNAQGGYSVTLAVSQLGQVTASVNGQPCFAQATLAGGTPTITNFDAVAEGGGLWDFSGTVTGAPTQGEVINFGGINALQNKQVNVNPDGTFNYFCIVSTGQGGWASAQAVDWWGDTSAIATEFVGC